MQIKWDTVHSPFYANAEGTIIGVTVNFDHLPGERLFYASASDAEPHGREIYAAAKAGQYGPIGSYVAPTPRVTAPPALDPRLITAVTQAIIPAVIAAVRKEIMSTSKSS